VLDASAAVAWVLRDADPEDEARIDELVSAGFVLVPELWHAEVANAFRSALRDDRIDETFVIGVCEQLDKLDIRTDVVGAQVLRTIPRPAVALAASHQQHLPILQAIYEGNGDQARALAMEHVEGTFDWLRGLRLGQFRS